MGSTTFYPPGSQISALTSVNDAAVRYLLDKSDCPYKVIGKEAQYCGGPPSAPSDLTATAASSSQINLAWTDGSNNESGFKIERCTGAGCTNFAQVGTAAANATSYTDTGLAASTSYTYQVRAYNGSWRLGLLQHGRRHNPGSARTARSANQPDRDGDISDPDQSGVDR